MFGEVIFSGKCIGAGVPITMWTWELGRLIPVTIEIIKASICFAAFAFGGVVVEGFGVALELGG